MTRVLHLLNYAGQGGTEQYIRTLLQAMEGQEVQADWPATRPAPGPSGPRPAACRSILWPRQPFDRER